MRLYLILILCLFSLVFTGNKRILQSTDEQSSGASSVGGTLLNLLFLGRGDDASTTDEYACVFCVLLVNTFETYVLQRDQSIDSFILDDYCSTFDSTAEAACRASLLLNGPNILSALDKSSNPDNVCRDLNLCTNPQCNLYPPSQAPVLNREKGFLSRFRNAIDFKLSQTLTNLLDLDDGDSDRDGFAKDVTVNYGTNWKGQDCDDSNDQIYPGRNVNPTSDAGTDYNCNGITGQVPDSATTYEDAYCLSATRIGIAVSGDSVGANFQIPAGWFNATLWNINNNDDASSDADNSNANTPNSDANSYSTSYGEGITSLAQDNFDIPQFSGFTGKCGDPNIEPCRSLYTYNVDNNRCNFNDFQNIAVNGATLSETVVNIRNLRRQQTLDVPLLLVLELLGNDICTMDMTTPDEFRQSLREIFTYLDTTLPRGSHVLILGVLDIDLYSYVAESTHISGRTYREFYEFIICLGVTNEIGCPTLLNPDQNVRNQAIQRARELNQVYTEEIGSLTATNFDAAFLEFPSVETLNQLAGYTINPIDLLNKVDGFHPSQLTHALLADYMWNNIRQNHSDWIGVPNPSNPQILQTFPDQTANF